MHERDAIFRERLTALMSALHEAGRDDMVRRTVGIYVNRMVSEAGARDWADLKERADGSTYDSMLRVFMKQSEGASKAGDEKAVRAFEALALSLIARRQDQPDLLPGIELLDRYVAECAGFARRTGAGFVPSAAN